MAGAVVVGRAVVGGVVGAGVVAGAVTGAVVDFGLVVAGVVAAATVVGASVVVTTVVDTSVVEVSGEEVDVAPSSALHNCDSAAGVYPSASLSSLLNSSTQRSPESSLHEMATTSVEAKSSDAMVRMCFPSAGRSVHVDARLPLSKLVGRSRGIENAARRERWGTQSRVKAVVVAGPSPY